MHASWLPAASWGAGSTGAPCRTVLELPPGRAPAVALGGGALTKVRKCPDGNSAPLQEQGHLPGGVQEGGSGHGDEAGLSQHPEP